MTLLEILAPILALIYVFQFARIVYLKKKLKEKQLKCEELEARHSAVHDYLDTLFSSIRNIRSL